MCKCMPQSKLNDMPEKVFNFEGLTLLSMSHTSELDSFNPYPVSAKLAQVV